MAEKETDDDEMISVTRGEWKEVIRIMKEDGVHLHKTYGSFLKSQEAPKEGEEKEGEDGEDGKPPPKKEEENEVPKKRGLWWGDRE